MARGTGDLKKEARVEEAGRRGVKGKVAEESAPEPEVSPTEPKVPRFNAEGVLLNPEDCHVSPEGVVTGRK